MNETKEKKIHASLKEYKQSIDDKLKESISSFGKKSPLRDACEYALLNGGKRFRPAIVLMVANALGGEADVTEAALGAEFFHTASLVADDLPCMDNDDQRRQKPSVHRVFGEAVALLVTYALIAAGYEALFRCREKIKERGGEFALNADRICCLAGENVSRNTGVHGATGGQFLDIFPPNLHEETVHEVLHKKTVTLFEASFVLGWLFGGGDCSKIDAVKKLACHFGLAFQIADDLEDIVQDAKNKRAINFASILGKEKASETVKRETDLYLTDLRQLGIPSNELCGLADVLKRSG